MAGISAILSTTFFPASTMAKMKHWVENRDFHTFILTISSTWCQAPQLKFSLTIHGLGWIIFEFQVISLSLLHCIFIHLCSRFSLCLILYLLCSKRAGPVFSIFISLSTPSSQSDTQCPSDIFSVNN